MNNDKRCREEDKQRLLEMLSELLGPIEHETIKEMYHSSRKIRAEMHINAFPIALLYRLSLYKKLDNEYIGLSTQEVAVREGVSPRRMYNIRKDFFKHSKQKAK